MTDSNIVALRVIGKRFPSTENTEFYTKAGHFLLLKAAGVSLWKLQCLPYEMLEHILLAIEPNACHRQLFVQRPEWQYVYEQSSLLAT